MKKIVFRVVFIIVLLVLGVIFWNIHPEFGYVTHGDDRGIGGYECYGLMFFGNCVGNKSLNF